MTSPSQMNMRRWLVRAEGAAIVATLVVTGLVAVVSALAGGGASSLSAVLGAGLVVVFFTAGALIDWWVLRRFAMVGILLVLAGYGLRIAFLSLAAGLMADAHLLSSPTWFAAGVASATIAWLVGLVVGHVTGRWPIYDLAVAL